MRKHTVRGYAEQAGFADCEVAPIEDVVGRGCLLSRWGSCCRVGVSACLWPG
jgi:hypothetical protein